jgi:hypothetical protein
MHSRAAGSWPLPKFTWAAPLPAAAAPGGERSRQQQGQQARPSKQAKVAPEQRAAPQQQQQLQHPPGQAQCTGGQLVAALLEAAPLGSTRQLAFLVCFWCAYLQACAELFSCCCSDTQAQQAGEPGWAAGSSAADCQRVDAAFVPGSLLGVIR